MLDKVLRHIPILNIPYYLVKDQFFTRKAPFPEITEFWLYVGDVGTGKTLAMVRQANYFRKKYGDKILIFSNFGYAEEDAPFENWNQFREDFDKPAIFLADEIHNEFESRNFKNFPPQILYEFSMHRKKRKMLLATCQFYDRIDLIVREYMRRVITTSLFKKRIQYLRHFSRAEFEGSQLATHRPGKPAIPFRRELYIAHDEIRELYDTDKIITIMRDKDYAPLNEQIQHDRRPVKLDSIRISVPELKSAGSQGFPRVL